jgi:ribosomal protein L10
VVIGRRDPAAVAKALAAFAKANPALQVRVGVIEGQVLDPQGLKAVADLPAREALRAQLVGVVEGPLVGLVSVLNAPLRELAYVLAERGRGAGSPPTDPAAAPEPVPADEASAPAQHGQEPEAAAPPA